MAARPEERIDYEIEHAEIFMEANRVYKRASAVRGQMWLEFPPSDKIRELRERVTRIEHAYEKREDPSCPDVPSGEILESVIIEDAIDIINYAAFLVKQIRRGQRG